MRKTKILVTSYSFPPKASGTSTVMKNLLKYFPPESYCVLTLKTAKGNEKDDLFNEISKEISCYRMFLPCQKLLLNIHFRPFIIPFTLIYGLFVFKKENIGALLAVYPDFSFFIASYIIHKMTKIPLFIYMHDTCEEALQCSPSYLVRYLSKSFEKKIFGASKKVFVISSALKKFYKNKYKTRCTIIPHPIDLTESFKFYDAERKREAEFIIVHTGSISSLNKDCIIRLAKAINQINKYDIRLILTGQEVRLGWIREMGISDEKVSYNFLKEKKEIISLQRNADILFGAISFNSPFPVESNTALPTKIIEYLTSQRPILIHAPKESFLAQYSREKGFGFVVDNPDSHELENAILKLLEDKILANNLIERAKMTKKEHDARKISGLIYQYLGLREQ